MSVHFQGWYFKCQSSTQTLAVIPALHTGGGERTASVQLITSDASWTVPFPRSACRWRGKTASIGGNRFSPQGFSLSLETPGLSAHGRVRFGPLDKLHGGIMGPFDLVPFLECRHSVYSMRHSVSGSLRINDATYTFRDGVGYWEGDRGRSFPSEYAWTQCLLPEGSVMLSVARIPLAGRSFTGTVGEVHWKGRRYRLATYLGARPSVPENRTLTVRQGDLCLTARLLEQPSLPLRAPDQGVMGRTIREHPACRAAYRLVKGNQVLLDLTADNASFEYEYPR